MSRTTVEIKNFVGLFRQANSLEVPEGAMEEAQNAVIRNTGRVDRRRGFYEVLAPSPATPNRLFKYEDTLLLADESGMSYLQETGTSPNKTLTQTSNGGEAFTLTGRVSRGAESAKNFYFTTDQGVMKLSSFDSIVEKSGVPPALDIGASFVDANGPVVVGQQAWRAVFGQRDVNDNLLLGAPGDSVILTNSEFESIAYTNPAANLVECTTLIKHILKIGMAFVVSNSSDAGMDGTQVVTAIISDTVFRFDKGSAVAPGTGTLDFTATRSVRLEISVPAEIEDGQGFFVQIYKSSNSGNENIPPFGDYKLALERELTTTEITTGVLFFIDDVPDLLLGAELYTNENSQEGELQANSRAPLCADIALFKEHMIYANVRTRHLLSLNVVDTTNLSNGAFVEIKVDAVTRRYTIRTGVANNSVRVEAISGVGTITITYTAHGLINNDVVRMSSIAGSLSPDEYVVSAAAANTFQISDPGNTATDAYFEGVRNAADEYLWTFDNTSPSISVQLRDTAQSLTKAINRDPSGLIYSRYVSGATDVPGQIRFESQGFGGEIAVRADTDLVGGSFQPTLTTSFDVTSKNDELPHVIFVSKVSEREAVPLVNFFEIGARNQPILRVVSLQDSLIIIKRDGIHRMVGDVVNDFVIAPLDTTLNAINPSTISELNNQVIMLTNQGIAAVTDSAVRIISHRIEDIIQPVISKDEAEYTGGAVGYESDRMYLISTLSPNETTLTTTYAYNSLTDSWTEWDVLFKQGVLGPNDTLYVISKENKILRERKLFTKLDYSDQNYAATFDSVATDLLSGVVTSAAAIPEVGDALVVSQVITRIRSVASLGANQYAITFRSKTNAVAADPADLYAGYNTLIKLAPYHGGTVGLMKRFAECQIHFRTHLISRARIRFAGAYQNSSIETEWLDTTVTGDDGSGGWGASPWGFFPWGNVDEERLSYSTRAVPIIRTYVPQDSARNTFLQLIFEHNEAAEPAEMQAVNYTLKVYNNRTTK